MKVRNTLFLLMILATGVYAKSYRTKHFTTKPPNNINGLYKFTGKLNDKIPVFLWFVLKDSVLKGQVIYLKTAKKIPIIIAGTLTKDDGLNFFEFGKGGTITGIYRGAFNATAINGTWSSPASQKELKYSLVHKDTTFTPVGMDLKPAIISGTYAYDFGKYGAGSINIKQLNPKDFAIDVACVTTSPANNIADVDSTVVHMVNNTMILKVPDMDCRFKIRVFNNLVVIDRLTPNLMNCGFGMNATIEGVFIKTSPVAKVSKNPY